MTVPILPTSFWNFSRGINDFATQFDQDRERKRLLQRQQDLQNVQLMLQMLPNLSKYIPPGQETLPPTQVPLPGGPIDSRPTPESFATPQPSGGMLSSLMRLTGAQSLNLSPEQQTAMRTNYEQSATAPARVEEANLAPTATRAKIAESTAQTGLATAQTGLAGAQAEAAKASTAKSLATAPEDFATLVAPGYVLNTGIPLTQANIPRIVSAGYQQFQSEDKSGYAAKISRSQFAKAATDYLLENQKLGIERLRAQADLLRSRVTQGRDLNEAVVSLREEEQNLIAKRNAFAKSMNLPVDENGELPPTFQDAKGIFGPALKQFKIYSDQINDAHHAWSQVQNALTKRAGVAGADVGVAAPAGVGNPAEVGIYQRTVANKDAQLGAVRQQYQRQALLNTWAKTGELKPEDAQRLATKYSLTVPQ